MDRTQLDEPPAVIIVVEPEFGELLVPLMPIAPIWVVATDVNKATYKRLWQNHKYDNHKEKGAITAFNVQDSEQRLNNLINIIPEVELHHALIAGDIIEVIGVRLAQDVIANLEKEGFSSFVENGNSFRAQKVLR